MAPAENRMSQCIQELCSHATYKSKEELSTGRPIEVSKQQAYVAALKEIRKQEYQERIEIARSRTTHLQQLLDQGEHAPLVDELPLLHVLYLGKSLWTGLIDADLTQIPFSIRVKEDELDKVLLTWDLEKAQWFRSLIHSYLGFEEVREGLYMAAIREHQSLRGHYLSLKYPRLALQEALQVEAKKSLADGKNIKEQFKLWTPEDSIFEHLSQEILGGKSLSSIEVSEFFRFRASQLLLLVAAKSDLPSAYFGKLPECFNPFSEKVRQKDRTEGLLKMISGCEKAAKEFSCFWQSDDRDLGFAWQLAPAENEVSGAKELISTMKEMLIKKFFSAFPDLEGRAHALLSEIKFGFPRTQPVFESETKAAAEFLRDAAKHGRANELPVTSSIAPWYLAFFEEGTLGKGMIGSCFDKVLAGVRLELDSDHALLSNGAIQLSSVRVASSSMDFAKVALHEMGHQISTTFTKTWQGQKQSGLFFSEIREVLDSLHSRELQFVSRKYVEEDWADFVAAIGFKGDLHNMGCTLNAMGPMGLSLVNSDPSDPHSAVPFRILSQHFIQHRSFPESCRQALAEDANSPQFEKLLPILEKFDSAQGQQ